MGVLFYAGRHKAIAKRLSAIIELQVSGGDIETYRTVEDLSQRLHQPLDNVDICILLLYTKRELARVLSMQKLVEDLRIIVVLPDDTKETLSAALKLYPRFISYVDSDFKDIDEVLKKMFREKRGDRTPRARKRGKGR